MRHLLWSCLATLVAACASAPVPLEPTCETGPVQLRADFPQARAADCERTGPESFSVTIAPEATPINPSPWYAFEIRADRAAEVRVALNYTESKHRYRPRRESADGWQALPETAVTLADDGRRAVIRLNAPEGRTKVAGQEWLPPVERQAWLERFGVQAGLTRADIGQTVDGRPLTALSGGSDTPGAPLVIILGGQHPPEVPGVLGLRAFLEALLLDPARAGVFLQSHRVLIVPEMNLDGVQRGHWRLNTGLIDLNRDWGPFSEPETRAVREEIDRLVAAGYRPLLMLDFHATRRNVFYTAPDGSGLLPAEFARRWLSAIDARWASEMPARSSSHNPGLPTSRSWFVETFAAPALTVEFGDHTPRDEIDALAEVYAAALVEVLGAAPAPEARP